MASNRPFEPFSIASVMQNAEALKSMKRQSVLDDLQGQYMRGNITRAESGERRAQAVESRASTEFDQEQQVTNTRLLNMAAAEVAQNPAAASRWDPILKAAIPNWESMQGGDPAQIQAGAKQLYESTTAALTAHTRGGANGNLLSTRVLENGNIGNVYRDGRIVDTGVKAQPQNFQFEEFQLPDGRTVQGTRDQTTGAVYAMDGAMLSPPIRGNASPGSPGAAAQPQPGLGQGRAPEAELRAKELAEADAEDLQNAPKRLQSATATVNQINDNVLPVLDSAIKNSGAWTVGLLSRVQPAGSPAADLAANLKTIEADTAFNELQAMRDASPTGGALGAISEREIDLLASRRRSLLQSQSPEQFRQNATALRQQYARTAQVAAQAKQVDQLKAQLFQLERRQPPPTERIQSVRNRIAAIEDTWWDLVDAPSDGLGGSTTGPVQIESDQDYAALPSGAEFIDPEGRRRRKP